MPTQSNYMVKPYHKQPQAIPMSCIRQYLIILSMLSTTFKIPLSYIKYLDLIHRQHAQIRLVNGPEPGHRIGMNRYRTGPESVDRNFDRYRDEPDRNYRDGSSVPSRSTIYRDVTGMNRNGSGWNGTGLTGRYFLNYENIIFFIF